MLIATIMAYPNKKEEVADVFLFFSVSAFVGGSGWLVTLKDPASEKIIAIFVDIRRVYEKFFYIF